MSVLLLARWHAREGEDDTVARFALALAAASRKEPGCLEYRVHQIANNPRGFVLVERYASAAALDLHRASDHFQRLLLEEIVPRLEQREVQQLEEL